MFLFYFRLVCFFLELLLKKNLQNSKINQMSLGSKPTVDGLEGYLYYVAPCEGKYDQVKVQLEALAKWYACCNGLALLIEDVTESCATISLLVLVPPGRSFTVEQEERCRWIQIECLACSLLRANLGVIRCSLQEPCRAPVLCQTVQPWVQGIWDNYVSVARYEFESDEDLQLEIQKSREWLSALNQSRQLLLRVLYFVNYDNSSVTFVYFFPDEAARDAFYSFLCCFMSQTVRCRCLDSTFDGQAWSDGASIWKAQLGKVVMVYDQSNSNCCKPLVCEWKDPLKYCSSCTAGCDAFCDECDEESDDDDDDEIASDDRAINRFPAARSRAPRSRAAGRSGAARSSAPLFAAPRKAGCCGGRK